MAARHRRKASGGGVTDDMSAPREVYSGAGSNVVKEAEEKKRGGRAKRKHGGHAMKIDGHMAKRRLDRPGRKMGGRTGADKAPLSSAHKTKNPVGMSLAPDEEGD